MADFLQPRHVTSSAKQAPAQERMVLGLRTTSFIPGFGSHGNQRLFSGRKIVYSKLAVIHPALPGWIAAPDLNAASISAI